MLPKLHFYRNSNWHSSRHSLIEPGIQLKSELSILVAYARFMHHWQGVAERHGSRLVNFHQSIGISPSLQSLCSVCSGTQMYYLEGMKARVKLTNDIMETIELWYSYNFSCSRHVSCIRYPGSRRTSKS